MLMERLGITTLILIKYVQFSLISTNGIKLNMIAVASMSFNEMMI